MQDNWEDKIRENFGSMNEADQAQASARKETIWSAVVPESEKKQRKYGWLLLLLAPLLFAAGWFLKPSSLVESNTTSMPIETEKTESIAAPMAATQNVEMKKIQELLQASVRQVDSLMKVNIALSNSLASNDSDQAELAKVITEVKTVTLIDTVYLTEIKKEEKLVEKIIRDTILIEVPVPIEAEPAVAGLGDGLSDESSLNELEASAETTPSSIQFNFSEADLKKN